jgi:hypothetical protein
MGWLEALRRDLAAWRYGRRLTRVMIRSWGASETYTPAQIRAAVRKLRLDRRYIALAYATFLSPEGYEAERANMPVVLDYDDARERFWTWTPSEATGTAVGPAPERREGAHVR